jgi:hypothetical protein
MVLELAGTFGPKRVWLYSVGYSKRAMQAVQEASVPGYCTMDPAHFRPMMQTCRSFEALQVEFRPLIFCQFAKISDADLYQARVHLNEIFARKAVVSPLYGEVLCCITRKWTSRIRTLVLTEPSMSDSLAGAKFWDPGTEHYQYHCTLSFHLQANASSKAPRKSACWQVKGNRSNGWYIVARLSETVSMLRYIPRPLTLGLGYLRR